MTSALLQRLNAEEGNSSRLLILYRSLQMNGILGDVLPKCGQLSASILSGPFDKILCLWTIVAKILEVQHHLNQFVGSRRRQNAAKDALRQLIVLDSLASYLADRLHDIFKRVEIGCRRQDLALTSRVRRGWRQHTCQSRRLLR
jgi:hypothetical protein